MKLRGRTVNTGNVEAEAIVLESSFSFTADFDPDNGNLVIRGHPLHGEKIAQKILVIPAAKGAVNASLMLYKAKKMDNAPLAILCRSVDPITVECAMTVDIPLMDSFDKDPIKTIKTGDYIRVLGEKGIVVVED